ncbi:hypothetical protein HPP92_007275 [Vanilla planifolia]|uniref:Uncharacterized protein n=1 Tax=Vanilla planifolia TaxID=51239 RepID=A0A835RR24_VANPL|nr:hypothetical protein HPP92_007275 [Vanilla planifolia]
MGPRTLPPLPRPSRSRPSSPTSEARSLVSLIRCSDHTTNDVLEEPKSRISLTFRNGGDAGKPPMAFADELFFNGFLVPLSPPQLKLPPRLQVPGEAVSPKSPRSPRTPRSPRSLFSPKSPASLLGFKKEKDFDPFAAALERIRKEGSCLKETFHWRSLEWSFERSYGRIFDEDEAESGWNREVAGRFGTFEGKKVKKCNKQRRHKLMSRLSCFG